MKREIRFIPYQVHDAAANMAIDEAILDSHLEGFVPATLRLYGWKPQAVSIGYGQKLSSTIERRMRDKGYDVVRRPTGGRAVLHAHELTYSFIGSHSIGNDPTGSESCMLGQSVIAAYKQICQGLIIAFRALGVNLSLGASDSQYRNAHDCFLATTTADLHFNGKKMIGSAQLRRHHAVLQHGSILLDQPQTLMRALLGANEVETETSDCRSEENARHANLFDITGKRLGIEELSEAMKTGFSEAFTCDVVESPLGSAELERADQYRRRYQTVLAL